jgi:threonyl-tRNA synthetase
VYDDFGFKDLQIKIALRPDKRIGSDEFWDRTEGMLRSALAAAGVEWQELPGEGAFYAPKIEYHLRDAIGRTWQLGTIQIDCMMPARLGAEYVGADSARHVPAMLHRAIVGSMERFIGILLEHHAGKLPTWLAPEQVVVLNITERQASYVTQVAETLRKHGLRVITDLRNEKIGLKIREHTLQRVPYLIVVGDKEVAANQLAVRTRSSKDLGAMSVETFVERLQVELTSYGRRTLED